jgi:hypothetical protein
MNDLTDTGQSFHLIRSFPLPAAEPLKLWLAQVAAERLDEMQDPELSIDRALGQYMKLSYSEGRTDQPIHLFFPWELLVLFCFIFFDYRH